MYTIYGIKNCNTMKKAFTALDTVGIDYAFFDYKKQPIDTDTIAQWVETLGMDVVLNKRGTTWRKQTDEIKAEAEADQQKAIELMAANPSMIKRPMLQSESILMAGFDADKYAQLT